ncbi:MULTISPECIES: bactofilin family protein [unclassified Brenneria]|uniref:bactofilin family protein n=1 Tax=unclassified Brenneria TaxID=2634434 RepID=UPI002E9E84A8|nr:polymer-forming cytoskeletal protein [Brenneria sp. HEZEL_4_2_4]
MRNYNLLWGLWAIWALLVIVWLVDIHMDLSALFYGKALVAVLGFALPALMAFFYKIKRNQPMFSFDKKKKSSDESPGNGDVTHPPALVNSVSPARVRKDTFIAQGARMAGGLTTDGNITVEGEIEGDVRCGDTIKVEHGGRVKGEMTSQQIIINGQVEGRVSAGVVSILAQGSVVGEIFSDELSIEKGGIFTGQSNPQTRSQEKPAYVEKKKGNVVQENIGVSAGNTPALS